MVTITEVADAGDGNVVARLSEIFSRTGPPARPPGDDGVSLLERTEIEIVLPLFPSLTKPGREWGERGGQRGKRQTTVIRERMVGPLDPPPRLDGLDGFDGGSGRRQRK